MTYRMSWFLLAVGLMWMPCTVLAQVPAFSGAEGFGAVTPGGRGGDVLHVTHIGDSGPGSFRAALEAGGPRTVVFDVSGIIQLESELNVMNPYLTIAGHTAPGEGIIVAGETVSLDTHDIIVRYMRFRRGAVDQSRRDDALGSDRTTGNIIIDHVSASWGLDENMSIYRYKINPPLLPGGSTVLPTRNVTIQWSISSEALNPFNHAFGSTLGGAGVNHHHNLWACNTGRNPSLSFSFFIDFRNNVLFNWRHRSVDGAGPEAHVNVINNYYKPGPATGSSNIRYRIVEPEIRGGVYYGGVGWWYVEGNVVEGYPDITADNWAGGVQFEQPFPIDWARVDMPHTHVVPPDDPDDPHDDDGTGPAYGTGNPLPIDLPIIAIQSAEDAYESILAGAGATLPTRDVVDQRVTDMVATGLATAGPAGNGIINHPDEVGGYPGIAVVTRSLDWDHDGDGMPTDWELGHGLDPNDAHDRNDDFDADGFTNLEDYLNELGAFPAVQDIVWEGAINNRYARIENWNIGFQPSRLDTVVINSGAIVVDTIGQDAGRLLIASGPNDVASLNIAEGWLKVAQEIVIGITPSSAGTLILSGGLLATPTLNKGTAGEFVFTGGTLCADEVNFDLECRGGTISPGGQGPGHMVVNGDLTLQEGSSLQIELGRIDPEESDSIIVNGDLTLGGTVDIIALPGLGENSYSLFTYTGTLTGTMDIGVNPLESLGYSASIDLSVPGTVRIIYRKLQPEP